MLSLANIGFCGAFPGGPGRHAKAIYIYIYIYIAADVIVQMSLSTGMMCVYIYIHRPPTSVQMSISLLPVG